MSRQTNHNIAALFLAFVIALAPAASVFAQADKTLTLDELLAKVKDGWRAEAAANRKRETDFKSNRANQKQLLEDALTTQAREEDRSAELEDVFAANEVRIAEQEKVLAEKLGTLGELFGVVRQVAGDTKSQVENSLISSQFPDRQGFLNALGQNKKLPKLEELEGLWYALQQEMTEQSKVVRYTAPVVLVSGEEVEAEVIRVGAFNAVADGKYLKWDDQVQKLTEIGRQPAPKYVDTVGPFEASTSGFAQLAIDPSRGTILSLLVDTPTFRERLEFGGVVGVIIMILGSLTFLLAVVRMTMIFIVSRKVAAQKKTATPNKGNPLGRMLQIYADNRTLDTETLELKLEEGLLRETAGLERFLWLIKVVSAVAPLLGLLGTVTGMINTFQIITLYGTGDPKMMAGGISEALVTTMLGLYAAIPLVLMHSVVASLSAGVTNVLEEQTTGLIAKQSEADAPATNRPAEA